MRFPEADKIISGANNTTHPQLLTMNQCPNNKLCQAQTNCQTAFKLLDLHASFKKASGTASKAFRNILVPWGTVRNLEEP